MLTDESPDIYLKRRRLALDYFRHIPEERVKMLRYTDGPDEWIMRETVGLDALKCNSVGCLAGWLWTLPEYRDWAGVNPCQSSLLAKWLGVGFDQIREEIPAPFSAEEYAGEFGMTGKAVALARLERLIKEAEEACR